MLKQLSEQVLMISALWERRMGHPQIFTGPRDDADVGKLVEDAQVAAANREFTASEVAVARRRFALVEMYHSAMEHDLNVEKEKALDDNAQALIARGYAWGEREAKANLSVLDRRVEMKAAEMKVKEARAKVRELEDVYQAWRDTEWALDRQAKLLALRSQLGEV